MRNKLEFILSHKCNQQCYYCNNYNLNGNNKVDIDYIIYLINIFKKYNPLLSKIELSGGEPALIENIIELLNKIYKIDYIEEIELLSNGLFRKNYNKILINLSDKLTCIEHPALNFTNKINYFYDDITYYNNNFKNVYQIIVLDKITTNNLIYNQKIFISFLNTFKNKNIKLKSLTNKVYGLNYDLINLYDILYNKLKNKNYFYDYELIKKRYNNIDINKQKECSKISNIQFIDLDKNKIGQCSMNIETSELYNITEENISKAIKGTLFKTNKCCEKCVKWQE